MLKKISAVCIGFLAFQPADVDAQTDSSKKSVTTFTGSVDAYYRFPFSDPPGTATNNLTSFTNSKNSFELGMASIKVEHTVGKVSATADLGFGRRAQEFSYNDVGTTLTAVKQAFVSYAPSSSVKFTLGKWATHVGYELLDAYANRNYSMSYGFSYGPFFHTGIKADISLGGKSAMMIGVANPTDYVSAPNGVKMVIAQFSTATKNDKLKAYLNFQGGTGISQFDLVLMGTLSSQFNIAYDGTIQTSKIGTTNSSWKAHALYLNYDPTSMFGLTLRADYFDDRKLSPVLGVNKVFATTLSGNIKIDNLTIIPEFRIDAAKNAVFQKGDGTATKSNGAFILAAVYRF
ncbi:porin [Sediminibacterium roseum]|uniref:Porin n=1 Tax=Sediminibacterium roseum TaxID=1978412 RepID=A0ABW9ZZW5_9BACT|nr:outer membrane beta-barrel protein [Sediminibacterium roseum]NCI50708.1 porin [Sediminibacterium roseum]